MSLGKLMYKKLKIEDLIILSQKGDYKALEELVKREQKHIYVTFLYLCKDDTKVQDLTQEALLKMSKNITSLRSPKTFKSWLNQIVMNLFYDDFRKCTKINTVSVDNDFGTGNCVSNPAIEIPDRQAKPLEKCLSCELENLIKQEIKNLPEYFRVPIVLRELQGLSYEDIAKTMDTNIGTVKSRIARARLRLKESLKDYIGKGV